MDVLVALLTDTEFSHEAQGGKEVVDWGFALQKAPLLSAREPQRKETAGPVRFFIYLFILFIFLFIRFYIRFYSFLFVFIRFYSFFIFVLNSLLFLRHSNILFFFQTTPRGGNKTMREREKEKDKEKEKEKEKEKVC